jgi:hypothetical protein
MPKYIETNVDKLFAEKDSLSSECLDHLLQRLFENHKSATDTLRKGLLALFAFWAVFFLIGSGTIAEGQILSFKVTQVKNLLIAAPIVAGIVYYRVVSAYATIVISRDVIQSVYRHAFPKLYSSGIEQLCFPHSLIDHERAMHNLTKNVLIKNVGSVIPAIMYLVISVVLGVGSLLHLSFLLVAEGAVAPLLAWSSIALGAVFTIQGYMSLVMLGNLRLYAE